MKPDYTSRQGQVLAFIHYYTKLNGRPPAENDMAHYFKITRPSAHQIVATLERRGLIERVAIVERHGLKDGRPEMPMPTNLLEHKNGLGVFINPDEGKEIMQDFTSVIAGLKRKGASSGCSAPTASSEK